VKCTNYKAPHYVISSILSVTHKLYLHYSYF